jgi:hypothetical protein
LPYRLLVDGAEHDQTGEVARFFQLGTTQAKSAGIRQCPQDLEAIIPILTSDYPNFLYSRHRTILTVCVYRFSLFGASTPQGLLLLCRPVSIRG